jgi:hypothetical protein
MPRKCKPYFSVVGERKGKTYKLPVNYAYRELYDCIRTLDIKEKEDEADLYYPEYLTILPDAFEPAKVESRYAAETTGKRLGLLTMEQADAVIRVCTAFVMSFKDIPPLIEYLTKESEE